MIEAGSTNFKVSDCNAIKPYRHVNQVKRRCSLLIHPRDSKEPSADNEGCYDGTDFSGQSSVGGGDGAEVIGVASDCWDTVVREYEKAMSKELEPSDRASTTAQLTPKPNPISATYSSY